MTSVYKKKTTLSGSILKPPLIIFELLSYEQFHLQEIGEQISRTVRVKSLQTFAS